MKELNCESIADATLQALCLRQLHFEEEMAEDSNNFFILYCSAMVLFMEAGLIMLSVGVLRPKNFKNLIMCTFLDFSLAGLAYYLLGFGLMFGEDRGGFIGTSHFVGFGVGAEPNGDYSFGFYLINFLWCAVRATLVTGATAERTNFYAYALMSFYGSLFVYPIAMHWEFGFGGFLLLGHKSSLMQTGVVDFAACGGLHMLGGLTGLVIAKFLGPRKGRYDAQGKAQSMPNSFHPALAALGAFILWTGWLGFNPGSTLTISGGRGVIITRAAINSLFSSCTAIITSVGFSYLMHERKFDTAVALNGMLGGLVSVTASCAFIELWAAFCVGAIGGVVYVAFEHFIRDRLRIDDPLDATAVHFGCGMWGLIAGAFFTNPVHLIPFFSVPEDGFVTIPSGVFYGGQAYMTIYSNGTQVPGGTSDVNGALVANAVVTICCVIAWVLVTYTPLVFALNKMGWLRASEDLEVMGLDAMHGNVYVPIAADMFPPQDEVSEHAADKTVRPAPAALTENLISSPQQIHKSDMNTDVSNV